MCIYIYMYIYNYKCIYIYTHIHTYTHIHIYIYILHVLVECLLAAYSQERGFPREARSPWLALKMAVVGSDSSRSDALSRTGRDLTTPWVPAAEPAPIIIGWSVNHFNNLRFRKSQKKSMIVRLHMQLFSLFQVKCLNVGC